MDDEFLIQLEILGKKYRLRILRKDEEMVRKAAKLVDELRDRYAGKYDVKELEQSGRELMALVAFHCAFQSLQAKGEANLLPFVERIDELNTELTAYLEADKNL